MTVFNSFIILTKLIEHPKHIYLVGVTIIGIQHDCVNKHHKHIIKLTKNSNKKTNISNKDAYKKVVIVDSKIDYIYKTIVVTNNYGN